MSLSVCSLTDAPAARVRAIMAPLREVADEIVLAADSRVPDAEVEEYGSVADRVLRCEVTFFEAHLAWLHAQCRCRWVLRLDGDESVSPALVRALPELVARDDVQQYWFPRRWLDTSGRGWHDELPWAPDYHNRLVRNDRALRFEGIQHTGSPPEYPAQYRPEPFYHLLCALETREERLRRSLWHELRRPEMLAPGGGPMNATFYLPERFARRPPRSLQEEDAAAVALVPL